MKQQTNLVKRVAGTLDPLYVIFEQHLFNFENSDSERSTFIHGIVVDYLTHLRKMSITVPKSLEGAIMEELASQVNTMLVKKIYGCLSIEEYQQGVQWTQKKKAKSRYGRLRKVRTPTKPSKEAA